MPNQQNRGASSKEPGAKLSDQGPYNSCVIFSSELSIFFFPIFLLTCYYKYYLFSLFANLLISIVTKGNSHMNRYSHVTIFYDNFERDIIAPKIDTRNMASADDLVLTQHLLPQSVGATLNRFQILTTLVRNKLIVMLRRVYTMRRASKSHYVNGLIATCDCRKRVG